MKYTTESIIEKFKLIHKDIYDYSLVEYTGIMNKVSIICTIHGIFKQTPNKHSVGQKCPTCANKEPFTKELFIKKANLIHGNRYCYDLFSAKVTTDAIDIICEEHGIFNQSCASHIRGIGCPYCGGFIVTTKRFIELAKIKHGDNFDYSLVDYTNNTSFVKIICKDHGIFEQKPREHLAGYGCGWCSNSKQTTESFIKKSENKHRNLYDYSLVDYKGAFKKVKIICNTHGMFEQIPTNHLKGVGCPKCKSSNGEREVINILDDLGIDYIHHHTFKDCVHIGKLYFDFYIPSLNLCIEYDGEQHHRPVSFGIKCKDKVLENFQKIKLRDEIKNKYCDETGIALIRILPTDNIKDVILKNIKR